MKKSWTAGLDAQERDDVLASYKASTVMRRRLKALLEDKIRQSSSTARAKPSYDNPNWAYLQADNVGFLRALHEIIDLIDE